ncbi:MAG: polysaccharide deacetylase family protein [Vicinamibacteria bacterium]
MGRAVILAFLAGAGLCAALGEPADRRSAAPGALERTMAVTVDDLPAIPARDLGEMRRITDAMLAAFRAHRVPAIGFVNERGLATAGEREARVALLRRWIDAGLDLGNHTYSHVGLQTTPLEAYEAEVLKGEVETRKLLAERGRTPRFFRHPFTQTGPTLEARQAFEAFLAAHGYAVAPFSVETSDYVFDAVREDALARKDEATLARLGPTYLDHAAAVVSFMEELAADTFGRPIPQILLIHADPTNADGLDAVLGRLEARGYRFVPLETALEDPAWRSPDGYVGRFGPSWLHRFRVAKGLPSRLRDEPDPPKWVLDAYPALQPR